MLGAEVRSDMMQQMVLRPAPVLAICDGMQPQMPFDGVPEVSRNVDALLPTTISAQHLTQSCIGIDLGLHFASGSHRLVQKLENDWQY